MKKYSMFIGRWQPWHAGHRWLIDQRLNEGKNVWIAIRDVEPNDNQPWTPHEVMMNIQKYGNTTAASVPIALCEAWEAGAVKDGDLVCLAAFGSGFTWGSALIRW